MASRVLTVDLGALERGLATPPAGEHHGPLATLASFGGSALGLAELLRAAEQAPDAPPPFVVAVGEAVRDGLATAARAALLARAPLSGLFAEGHVGGELGARLARTLDALVLRGRTELAGAVLVLPEDGQPALVARPELRGLAAGETNRRLALEFAPASVLSIGPAGENGVALASLASGHAPPSFVGRGGLGAAFGALGLKALVVRGVPAQRASDEGELARRLARSPRLAARAQGGTLELVAAAAARGELAHEAARALGEEIDARREARHGCRGCPTPCGWVFERAGGGAQGARFGAGEALGSALGLAFEDALELLALCDELGIDAREVGALLGVELAAGRFDTGSRAELARRIRRLCDPREPGARGAGVRARELGLAHTLALARGQAVRPARELAERLGQCVASGGTDPMKSFPFLLESAAAATLAELVAPQPLPPAALEAQRAFGKGRLVWGHENLSAAVDLTGFCAFSAAGLLADGLATLDELARWILPTALRAPADPAWAELAPRARLLAAGASVVLARRRLNARWNAPAEQDEPEFARAELALPGMLDEYRLLRGLDARGRPTPAALAALGTPRVLALAQVTDAPRAPERERDDLRRPGRVRIGGTGLAGPLAPWELELELPATLAQALERLHVDPRAPQLFLDGRFLPAVFRRGQRITPAAVLDAGDALELVTAIGGG